MKTESTLEQERVTTPSLSHGGTGDGNIVAHYVRGDKIVDSAVFGEALTALCGKVWVPSRDPKQFPLCPICKEIYDGLRPGPKDDKPNN